MRTSARAFAILLLSLTAVAQTASPIAQPLIASSRTLLQAQKSGDVATAQHLLAPDFHSIGSEGKMHDRGDFLDNVKDAELKDFRTYSEEVFPIDDSAVLVTFNCIIQQPEGDYGLAPRYQHISDLWVKRGDQWMLKFQQSSPLRPID